MNRKINSALAISVIIIIAIIFSGIIYFGNTAENKKTNVTAQEQFINTKQPTKTTQQNETEQKPANSEIAKDKTCNDSDGLDYYTKGELTVCDFKTVEEPGSDSPIGCALHYDICDSESNALFEHYCDGQEYKFEMHECDKGCQDGACIK